MPDLALLDADLIRDEAEILVVYDDATGKPLRPGDTIRGVPTIGTGINLLEGITKAESDLLRANRVARILASLDAAFPWWRDLSEPRRRGLVEMAFNLGLPRLKLFRAMLVALQAGDWQRAHDEALDSRWAGQVGERSRRIADLFLKG
jgi:lysozyme